MDFLTVKFFIETVISFWDFPARRLKTKCCRAATVHSNFCALGGSERRRKKIR